MEMRMKKVKGEMLKLGKKLIITVEAAPYLSVPGGYLVSSLGMQRNLIKLHI
jgi:hypothetical protein